MRLAFFSDVHSTARAILASELPHEFAAQVREARGYVPSVAMSDGV